MSVPQRFGILRLIGALLKVMAWFLLVGAILLALVIGLAGPLARQFVGDAGLQPGLFGLGAAGGVITGVLLMVGGVVLFLVFYAAGENIFLQLAIEENTRITAALLLRTAEKTDEFGGVPPTRSAY